MNSTQIETVRIHKFEQAGLGKAPFQVVGNYESKFQAVAGDPNCPIKPGSSCDYCGQGIMNVFVIRSSDGREFKVGCECVNKAGDEGLKKVVNQKVAEHNRVARHARETAKIEAGKKLIEDSMRRLESLPHPNPYHASQGKTAASYVSWMMENSGNSGKLRTIRYVQQVLGEQ